PAFEVTSKRRKGYPSETRVQRGQRFVHGDKELVEKLGRNDPCPCGSARRFKAVLHAGRPFRRHRTQPLLPRLKSGAEAFILLRSPLGGSDSVWRTNWTSSFVPTRPPMCR